MVVISDPLLAAEVLDRSKCPEYIDKPSDRMMYKAFDEVSSNPHCPHASNGNTPLE